MTSDLNGFSDKMSKRGKRGAYLQFHQLYFVFSFPEHFHQIHHAVELVVTANLLVLHV